MKDNKDLYLYLMGHWRDINKDGYLGPRIYDIIALATMHLTGIWEDDDTWNPFSSMDTNDLYEFYQGYTRGQIWDVWVQFFDNLRSCTGLNHEVKSLPSYIRYCSFMHDLFEYLDGLGYKDGKNISIKDAEKGLRILKIKLKNHILGIDLENIYAGD